MRALNGCQSVLSNGKLRYTLPDFNNKHGAYRVELEGGLGLFVAYWGLIEGAGKKGLKTIAKMSKFAYREGRSEKADCYQFKAIG